ncbi:hypothetical protein EDB85DRAFT_112960 [Lactarius pseudohatsudake]|nr:hypothetical protein EDB85DRAFT_112960 [Lactarius pseudohatsudake]
MPRPEWCVVTNTRDSIKQYFQVPIIVVFTKYDQFQRNVKINLEDQGNPDDNISDAVEKQFREHYLDPLGDGVRFVRLEQMHREHMRCDKLIETTAAALNDGIIGLMLLAVQKDNLELSVKTALKRVRYRTGAEVKLTYRECLIAFPYLWIVSGCHGVSSSLTMPVLCSPVLGERLPWLRFQPTNDGWLRISSR